MELVGLELKGVCEAWRFFVQFGHVGELHAERGTAGDATRREIRCRGCGRSTKPLISLFAWRAYVCYSDGARDVTGLIYTGHGLQWGKKLFDIIIISAMCHFWTTVNLEEAIKSDAHGDRTIIESVIWSYKNKRSPKLAIVGDRWVSCQVSLLRLPEMPPYLKAQWQRGDLVCPWV